jgi:tetratricopeptide (TPR) repeat protein
VAEITDQGGVGCTFTLNSIGATKLFHWPLLSGPTAGYCTDFTACKVSLLCWGEQASETRAFLDAASALAHQPSAVEQAAAFAEVAQKYRETSPKPVVPEAARAYLVQAADASDANRLRAAVDDYEAAIEIAPWIPGAHYNLAWVKADNGDFQGAATEMEKYLLLVPNAPNARAARDQIYIWRGREPRRGE